MVLSDQKLSEEDLKVFLDEIGVSKPDVRPIKTRDESPSPSLKPLLALTEEKRRPSRLPLWFSLTLLCGFFMGGIFGFFLGKTEPVHPQPAQKIEAINTQLFSLIDELQEIYKKNEIPEEEIIEPLEPPSQQELLFPKVFSYVHFPCYKVVYG